MVNHPKTNNFLNVNKLLKSSKKENQAHEGNESNTAKHNKEVQLENVGFTDMLQKDLKKEDNYEFSASSYELVRLSEDQSQKDDDMSDKLMEDRELLQN